MNHERRKKKQSSELNFHELNYFPDKDLLFLVEKHMEIVKLWNHRSSIYVIKKNKRVYHVALLKIFYYFA